MMNKSFGRLKRPLVFRAALLVAVCGGFYSQAAEAGVAPHFYPTWTFCGVWGLAFLLGSAGAWMRIRLWRARILREFDEEIRRVKDQSAKDLQREAAAREAAQQALQQSQELAQRQERLARVGQTAARLAHELNNVLTIIQGHASLLLDNPNMDKDTAKSIANITDGVERTATLVKQMLGNADSSSAGNTREKTPPDTGTPRTRGGGETVLVVDDEAVLREMVREILEAGGYRILEAGNGREALQVWEKQGKGIHVVLTDMTLPDGISGRDLAAKLQEGNPRLPVILSSGHNRESLGSKAQAGPGLSFLSKPYHPADLARAVRAALDNAARRESSPAAPNSPPHPS